MKGTQLLYRTPYGGSIIKCGTIQNLVVALKVREYPSIRLLIDNRKSSNSTVSVSLIFTEEMDLLIPLDIIILPPGKSFTKVYDIPGTALTIRVEALPENGHDSIDLFIYGFGPYPNTYSYC